MPDFSLEDCYDVPVCGIDEVGRGPLAGPVVAAAVVIDRRRAAGAVLEQINDSKKLSARKREYLYHKIHEFSDVAIATCSPEEIDHLNILQASLKAMARAYEGLSLVPEVALVDGNKAPRLQCRVQTVIKGDSISLSIAAASIVAKEYRDRLMREIANDYPCYGWERNAGYPTKEHLLALEQHGITPHHRRSFAPVRQCVSKVF